MPNRIIKESVCTSEQIDQLTPSAEVLFYRLMVNADDYGRFDARMKMIASKCYPLKSSDIKCIAVDFASLQAAGLISVYEVEGRPYGCFVNWAKHQQIRAKRAKFPDPADGSEIICNQVIADVPVIQSNPIQSESESKKEGADEIDPPAAEKREPRKAETSLRPDFVSESVWADFMKVRKAHKAPMTKTALDGIEREAAKAGITLQAALETCCAKGWRGFDASWLAKSGNGQSIALTPKPARHPAPENFSEKRYGQGGLL